MKATACRVHKADDGIVTMISTSAYGTSSIIRTEQLAIAASFFKEADTTAASGKTSTSPPQSDCQLRSWDAHAAMIYM